MQSKNSKGSEGIDDIWLGLPGLTLLFKIVCSHICHPWSRFPCCLCKHFLSLGNIKADVY
jgi:hypothetical protein